MDKPKYPAIDVLCAIIAGFPDARRKDAITYACLSVGRSADPTGLKPTIDRPIKQLHWDLTIEDLRARLIELVDDVGMDESAVVLGVVGYLDWHYERHADHSFSEQARDNHVNTIARLHRELEKPVEQRDYKASNDDINKFIEKMQDTLNECEQRRQDAEESLHYLRGKTSEVFTWQFWNALTMYRIGDPRRLLDDLEDTEDDT